MKEFRAIYTIFCLIVFLPFTGCSSENSAAVKPKAIDGVLDCSGCDFVKDGPIELRGEWDFYWNQLIEPEDLHGSNPPVKTGSYYVPASWNKYMYKGEHLPGMGHATYHLRIITEYRGRLALSRLHPNTAFRLWVNGEISSEAGIVGIESKHSEPGQLSQVVAFQSEDCGIDILIQVSNYSYSTGGLWEKVKLGTEKQISAQNEKSIAFDMFLFGVLFIIGLYYLGLYIVRKKDRSSLWFGIFSTLLAVRVLVTNQMFILNLYPGINWELIVKLNFLTFIAGVPIFLEFISCIYIEFINKKTNSVIYILSGINSIIIIIFPAGIYSQIIMLFHSVIIFTGVYISIVLIRAVIKRSLGALIAIIGFIMLFFTAIHDILLSYYIISSIHLVPVGIFIFILAQSFNLSRQFARAFITAEDLSENLEKKVRQRTDELEIEKNRLKERNDIMERELILARRIQQQMIPSTNPVDYIHTIYKPMEKVGGDYFDFITFHDSDSIGIFLSDVSGHGVPAAFITSMVKTLILQSDFRRYNPAHLLLYLNELLFNQTGGNFITAFYCIYDPGIRKLTFANAGHNPPYLVGDKISELTGQRSVPLATLSNSYLEGVDKLYQNNEIFLEEKSKLLLYTDGFVEATSIGDRHRYFEEHLEESLLKELKNLSSREFVQVLFQRLIQFRGGDHFDDDVCLICVDVA